MYEVFVNILTWTAVGAVCHFLVVLFRMKLADRRSRTVFTEKTYLTARTKALNETMDASKVYRSIPNGELSVEAFRIFSKRQRHLTRLAERFTRERPDLS